MIKWYSVETVWWYHFIIIFSWKLNDQYKIEKLSEILTKQKNYYLHQRKTTTTFESFESIKYFSILRIGWMHSKSMQFNIIFLISSFVFLQSSLWISHNKFFLIMVFLFRWIQGRILASLAIHQQQQLCNKVQFSWWCLCVMMMMMVKNFIIYIKTINKEYIVVISLIIDFFII